MELKFELDFMRFNIEVDNKYYCFEIELDDFSKKYYCEIFQRNKAGRRIIKENFVLNSDGSTCEPISSLAEKILAQLFPTPSKNLNVVICEDM